MSDVHQSVLKSEAVTALEVQSGSWYIDATFGRGGHTRQILAAGGRVLALDCDQAAITYGQDQFADQVAQQQLILVHQNFDQLTSSWRHHQVSPATTVAGVLFDFGVSSPQLDTAERGFSFRQDGPLDMRMDQRLGVQAKDLLMVLSEKQLAELFWQAGGELHSRKIAKMIVQQRQRRPFTRTLELAAAIAKISPRSGHLHPATKVFQALRIAVNSELDSIHQALPQAYQLLALNGRLVTISFHEGEDRIVKQAFRDWVNQGKGQLIERKALTPSVQELTHNPRARSAKLRIFVKKER